MRGDHPAICVHAFYPDGWALIADAIRGAQLDADIFVTCPRDSDTAGTVRRDFPSAEIVSVDNRGMDVLPFLKLCHRYDLHRRDSILKLHTKNSASELRALHGKLMLESTLGTSGLAEEVVSDLRDKGLGMVGSEYLYRCGETLMYGSRNKVARLFQILRVKRPEQWGFFAGTSFWTRGDVLTPFVERFEDLAALFLEGPAVHRTGGDGGWAHAIERALGAVASELYSTVGLVQRVDRDGERLALRHARVSETIARRSASIGVTDSLHRLARLGVWLDVVERDRSVDEEHYRSQLECGVERTVDAGVHYIMTGEVNELEPRPGYSVGKNSLLNRNPWGEPTILQSRGKDVDPRTIATQARLFDPDWYDGRAEFETDDNEKSWHHFRLIGQFRGASPSPLLPFELEALNGSADPFGEYLNQLASEERFRLNVAKRALENLDFERGITELEALLNDFGMTRATVGSLSMCYAHLGRWEDLRALWDRCWAQYPIAPKRWENWLFPVNTSGNGRFPSVERRSKEPKVGRICVYTSLFGEFDELEPVRNPVEGVDYICFTDREREAEGWEYRVVSPDHDDPNLAAKRFKVLPAQYLPDYEWSLFVDANTVFLGRVDRLIHQYLVGNEFVMWRHPERCDVYAEAGAVGAMRRHEPFGPMEQVRAYERDGLPRNSGMLEASFIWRRNHSEDLRALMALWWEHITRFTKRDQLSLGYLLWKHDTTPRALPDCLGTARDNAFFAKKPHKSPVHPSRSTSNPRPCPRDIWFLYDPTMVESGSTVMRGEQLSEIAREAFPERQVIYAPMLELSNRVIWVTKGFAKKTNPAALRRLRERGNVILLDLVDDIPTAALVEEADVVIASSLSGYVGLQRRFPTATVCHVTHHVDPRLPVQAGPGARLRVAYFGEPLNTTIPETVKKRVELVPVDTSSQDAGWIKRLPEFNAHYAVRRARRIDGFKPFLKGFVAAQMGSPILVQRSVNDAEYYLGPDYPYLIDQVNPSSIATALDQMEDDYGTAVWRGACDVMDDVRQRSSREFIRAELRRAIP